ncbi:MAG: RIP metalloprotease RseP [Bacilli bacterium]|nr:RIP metalloprotease RseP [Bacilli bacterium]
MWILTLLLFVFILSLIILIHELGHFFWAKKCGVHIYEFSIGMGPVIFSKKGKDKIDYNIRAFPIGGFVQMAGEVYEDDKKIPKKKFMCNKPWHQRLMIIVAGVLNNFIMALVLLFVYALIWGAPNITSEVKEVIKDYPAYEAGLREGDKILEINGKNAKTWDAANIILVLKNKKDYSTFKVEREDGTIEELKITPKKEKDSETEQERNVYGFAVNQDVERGIIPSIKYAFQKFGSIVHSMVITITSLFTGALSVNMLSGPVGIYQVVDQSAQYGLANIIYLVAFLSINVGFINILPFPAFDGGRALFMVIEKIKGSPVNSNFENMCHTIGFILLLILMIYISFNDILRLF